MECSADPLEGACGERIVRVKVLGKRLSPARAPKATAPDSEGSLTGSKGNRAVTSQMPSGVPVGREVSLADVGRVVEGAALSPAQSPFASTDLRVNGPRKRLSPK